MNRHTRYVLSFAALAMGSLSLGGCNMKQQMTNAGAQVAQFHRLLDAGQVEKIWDEGTPALHASTTQKAFTRLLNAVHGKLGTVQSSKQVAWGMDGGTAGSGVSVTMKTTFARGSGTEQFTFTKGKGGRLRLGDYAIQSEDMMLN